ncbi:hypothetical protein H072_6252 [Dactylellina haptotyla CBS 200.50]|uniref:Opi1-domain-containing protein n=1 Tax=Dactylellina haptotyla (strain CBS 200.50) TaxID=1284197 RepID=S8BWU5_DACHA|nr:hypothetical protein H072_6252 [Dactylellina haptotyla CBS 200.50]
MATRPRSQSTTPKPPSALISPTSTSKSPASTSASTSGPSAASDPAKIVFNTAMFASPASLRDPLPAVLPLDRDLVVAQAQAQDSAILPPPPPPPQFSEVYPLSHGSGNNYTLTHPQTRSMSIQSIVSTTSSNTFADDDASSTISHTTTRNTEDLDDDPDLSVDIDDPDVRMAAEALGDLRADFVSSPKSVPNSPPAKKEEKREERRQESMMEMIQGQNTLLGTAVRAGRSVYRGGKRYSPRFKYGAEMVERAAAPMTSVVSYAARTTGVESVLRRNFEARRLSSSATSSQSSPSHSQPSSSTSSHATKRRKTQFEDGGMDVDSASPTSSSNERGAEREDQLTHKPATDVVSLNWQRRLMLSTAGVGVALSEESLKSLKYCLAWLRWANDHLDKVIMALRGVISEYDSENKSRQRQVNGNHANGEASKEDEERSLQLQHKIDNLRKDVIGTLKRVVDVVSTYAGGALPENARVVVKACITNLPRRWALAAKDDPSANGANGNGMAMVVRREEAGKRVLVLAREGLEMLHQVSAIVQLTLERAEDWCERLGRKRPEEGDYGKVGWEMEMEMDETEEARKDR